MHAAGGLFSTFRLAFSAAVTALLVIAELALGHHSRCLTLLVVSDQTIYNLLTLVAAVATNKVRI